MKTVAGAEDMTEVEDMKGVAGTKNDDRNKEKKVPRCFMWVA
jgi:hypothetical protein